MNYDFLVIGGGMSGISIAHFLRDRKVLILERAQLLSEASGKNAGFIISGFGEHFHRTVSRWGIQRANQIQQIHLSNHRRIRNAATRIDCDYRNDGSLATALDDSEKTELRDSCELMLKEGYRVEWVERPETGLKTTRGALLNRDDASMDPLKFWSGLAQGLSIETGCEALEVEEAPNGIRVRTSKGDFHASNVIFCLNAFAAKLVPELEGRFVPLRGQMVELPLLGDPPTLQPVYARHGDLYWRFTQSKLILGGLEDQAPDEEVGIAKEVSPEILRIQKSWIDENFRKALVGPEASRAWCSTMAFTVDGFPFVGALPGSSRRFVLSGLCGLGHGYALECASWLKELMETGKNLVPDFCSSDRIKNLPRYTGGPWRNLYEAWNY